MAQRVVDRLEPVEIEQEQAGGPVGAGIARQRLVEGGAHPLAIGKASQAVGQGETGNLRLRTPLFGQVGARADKALEPAERVDHRPPRDRPPARTLRIGSGADRIVRKGGAGGEMKGQGAFGAGGQRIDPEQIGQGRVGGAHAATGEVGGDLVGQVGDAAMPVRFPEPAGALILELRHHLGGGTALGRFLRVRVGGRPVDQPQPPVDQDQGAQARQCGDERRIHPLQRADGQYQPGGQPQRHRPHVMRGHDAQPDRAGQRHHAAEPHRIGQIGRDPHLHGQRCGEQCGDGGKDAVPLERMPAFAHHPAEQRHAAPRQEQRQPREQRGGHQRGGLAAACQHDDQKGGGRRLCHHRKGPGGGKLVLPDMLEDRHLIALILDKSQQAGDRYGSVKKS